MSTAHNYDHWQTLNARVRPSRAQSTASIERRSVDVDEHNPHSMSLLNQFPCNITSRPTSSLAGAMDESAMTSARASQTTLTWDTVQTPYPQLPDTISPLYYGMSSDGSCSPTTNMNFPSRNHSPESLLSVSSSGSPQQYPGRFQSVASPHPTDTFIYSVGAATVSSDQTSSCDDVLLLRERIRELEQECRRARTLIDTMSGRSPYSPSLQADWNARTEARMKIYCSLNRAGNALCSWHDSRRERRKYAPRNAPQGKLNCDCTFEEALFEESLSHHGVGSYHPGETVRMDPALRNPLLKLLERRYGYKDGDFDFDPINGTWIEGRSPEDWGRKSLEGRAARVRN